MNEPLFGKGGWKLALGMLGGISAACAYVFGIRSIRGTGQEIGFKQGQQSIEKVLYIGDVDKDGHKDIAAVFKNKENGKTYKILYGTKEGTYILKVEGLGKDGLPLDYSEIEKRAIELAKKLDKPLTQEDINKKIVDGITDKKYKK